MLRESFAGRNPTHFVNNSIVKAFIISEVFLWSSWFAVIPLFGIFVVEGIPGGNIQLAASGFSVYLISRVIFELISGKMLVGGSETRKLQISIIGILLAGIATISFALADSILSLFLIFPIIGLGVGIASPAKNSLFSSHLDKSKDTTEWGIYDAVVFVGIALSTALGGFIATDYGFKIFFIIAGTWMLLGIIPYLLYLRKS